MNIDGPIQVQTNKISSIGRQLSFLLVLFFWSCNPSPDIKLFSEISSDQSGIAFNNKLEQSDTFSILDYMYFFNGGGVAVGDINNDKLPDLYFAGNRVSNSLYINQGNLKFKDVTQISGTQTTGWSSGVAMIDINSDQWLDIYVCRSGHSKPESRRNLLFVNNQDGTFSERAIAYGIADTSYSTQAAFFDYDRDGDLDLYLLNHDHQFVGANAPLPKKIKGEASNTDKLFRQQKDSLGQVFFQDVSMEAGITIEGFGLGVSIEDLNQDGWPDIYVANDFISNDILYINQHDGTFINQIQDHLDHQSHNGMGVDIADFNNDGHPDIFVADMLPADPIRYQMMALNTNQDIYELSQQLGYQPQYTRNTLQLNLGQNQFGEIGQLAGVSQTDWSWSALLSDLDNDGWKDLFITNGYYKDITNQDFISYRQRRSRFSTKKERDSLYLKSLEHLPSVPLKNYLFKNQGNLTFCNYTSTWSDFSSTLSNGAVAHDLDMDGDQDLIINHINAQAGLFENTNSTENNYLKIDLVGPSRNPNGIGVEIHIYHGAKRQTIRQQPVRGYCSSSIGPLHFGLGTSEAIDSLQVIWPDQRIEKISRQSCNQTVVLNYENASPKSIIKKKGRTLFVDITSTTLTHVHLENKFSPFKNHPLQYRHYAKEGPALVAADFNGDGEIDLFIGGAAQQPSHLFLQRGGIFQPAPWPFSKNHEDVDALAFDVDGDDDLDLYVVSGGSVYREGSHYYQDRLYLNDGQARFIEDTTALPRNGISGACVAPGDMDADGDLDLFIGGRHVPGNYAQVPNSQLLENRSGKFFDVTSLWSKSLKNIGMVSSATWTDYNDDHQLDLVVVGEWMEVNIFENGGQKFHLKNPAVRGFEALSGWWQHITAQDIDGDGDQDFLLGNIGLNTGFEASERYPLYWHIGDLNDDGTIEGLLSHYRPNESSELKPVVYHRRDQILSHMPDQQKIWDNYASFAQTDVLKFYKDQFYKTWSATTLASGSLLNQGDGTFIWRPWPVEAQVSAVRDIVIDDVNQDGTDDMICVGNADVFRVETGRQDASKGGIFLGDGTGDFKAVAILESGLQTQGDTRRIVAFQRDGQTYYVVAVNNGITTMWQRSLSDSSSLIQY